MKLFTRVVLAIAVLCFALPVFCQTESAAISGRITDPKGAVLVGADVRVQNVLNGQEVATKTNSSGLYVVRALQPGTYRIIISDAGFKQIVKPGVILNIQDNSVLNFVMTIGSASETVTVSAGAPMVNTTDASVSTVIDQTYIANMPLNGRSFQDLILLTPGVVTATPQNSPTQGQVGNGLTGEFSVNGQRTESNYYTVDGVSANVGVAAGGLLTSQFAGASGSVAGATALGTTQALVSVDDLQEFRVQSSTYSAEYGRNPGGQFAFETKSGTNQFHGTAYEYLRNDMFDANDWFNGYLNVKQPPLRQNDFGGTLGGPVRIPHLYNGRDKTFFFFSYEGLRLTQPQPAATFPVPDNDLRMNTVDPSLKQVLNAFPVQSPDLPDDVLNGVAQFKGSWSNPSSIDSTSVRFDHVVSDKMTVFFRFGNTTSDSATRGFQPGSGVPPSQNTVSAYTTRTYTGGVTGLLTNRLSNELRLNYTSNLVASRNSIDAFGGSTRVDLLQLTGLPPGSTSQVFFILGPYFLTLFETKDVGEQRQWNLVDTVGISLGRHQLRFGVDYRRLTPVAVPSSPSALYLYFDPTSVQTNTNALGFLSAIGPAHPLFTNFSLFAEDEWKVAARLSVSLGLRWDVNPAPGVTRGLKGYTLRGTTPDTWTLAPQGTPLWQTTWFNFAPRLGAAYQIRDKEGWETVARAGGGLFFDTGQQLGSTSFGGPGFTAFNPTTVSSFPCSPAPCSAGTFVPQLVNPPQPPLSGATWFAPHLQLPYTIQWNASVEQAMGKSQALTISYVGSHAGRLLQLSQINSTNPILQSGARFTLVQNGLTSDYGALQLQFQRRFSHGLTALASHTWSHCLDYGSSNIEIGYTRGNCAFDVRHNFNAALSYDLPRAGHGVIGALLSHWGIDDRFTARTGFPVDVTGPSTFDPLTGKRLSGGLDFVTGQPLYISGTQCDSVFATDFGATLPCPAGRAINPDAFVATSGLGHVPRNFLRGFGAWQMNFAVRREFPIHENVKIAFRAEAFNIFNHPNFGTVNGDCGGTIGVNGCTNSQFGQTISTLANSLGVLSPLYQMGGSRSMQFAVRLLF